MNAITATLVITLLLIARFAVPLVLMGGLCYSLDCLFKRWDMEAKARATIAGTD